MSDDTMWLFDQERIFETYVESEKREAAAKATKETVKSVVENILKIGKMSPEEIAGCFKDLSADDIRKIAAGMK